ncbi:SID1 transmembrane family member 1 [Portunus trituberculatus]|uniref:SID1 transmembrane family member 1 n=1 Tax=Portunus trituberculatus TaxID=210409 RepID=A0A5B7DSC5_PORTR|nr:SID1 transmembrane family member 1 [Portunus trituberculatus]
MMFMYVMMVVAIVTIWGLRHSDVTHHVYPTVITVGLALLVAEARLWLSRALSKLWHVWSAWKPIGEKLSNVLSEQDTSHKPMEVVRVLVGVGSNIGLILFGILADPDVYNFILVVCLVNLGLYFANYVMMKKLLFKEKGTVLAWVCLALSSVFWIIALVFFFQRRTDSERSPADSRSKNSPCDFLSVFDEHDIWHITSAFALFFFFVALLTMDDDLCNKPSQEIKLSGKAHQKPGPVIPQPSTTDPHLSPPIPCKLVTMCWVTHSISIEPMMTRSQLRGRGRDQTQMRGQSGRVGVGGSMLGCPREGRGVRGMWLVGCQGLLGCHSHNLMPQKSQPPIRSNP